MSYFLDTMLFVLCNLVVANRPKQKTVLIWKFEYKKIFSDSKCSSLDSERFFDVLSTFLIYLGWSLIKKTLYQKDKRDDLTSPRCISGSTHCFIATVASQWGIGPFSAIPVAFIATVNFLLCPRQKYDKILVLVIDFQKLAIICPS